MARQLLMASMGRRRFRQFKSTYHIMLEYLLLKIINVDRLQPAMACSCKSFRPFPISTPRYAVLETK